MLSLDRYARLAGTAPGLGEMTLAEVDGQPVVGEVVVCPLHRAQFDTRTGDVQRGPARTGIRIRRVAIDGSDLPVER